MTLAASCNESGHSSQSQSRQASAVVQGSALPAPPVELPCCSAVHEVPLQACSWDLHCSDTNSIDQGVPVMPGLRPLPSSNGALLGRKFGESPHLQRRQETLLLLLQLLCRPFGLPTLPLNVLRGGP